MKEIVKPGIILFVITVIAAAALGLVNFVTKPAIAANAAAAKKAAAAQVLPGVAGDSFSAETLINPPPDEGVASYSTGYNGQEVVGWAMTVYANGYGGRITLLVGIDVDGVITGMKMLDNSETPGLGTNAAGGWSGRFSGKSGRLSVVKGAATAQPGTSGIQAITSATITSRAVTDGVNAALKFYDDRLKEESGSEPVKNP